MEKKDQIKHDSGNWSNRGASLLELMRSPVQVVRTWLQNTKKPFRGRPQRTNLIILQNLIHNTALWKYLWKDFMMTLWRALTTTFRQVWGYIQWTGPPICLYGHWPSVCVEIQLHRLLLRRKGPFGSLVTVVQDFRVVWQPFIMANILVQRIPKATWNRIPGYSQTGHA